MPDPRPDRLDRLVQRATLVALVVLALALVATGLRLYGPLAEAAPADATDGTVTAVAAPVE
jgi:Ni,Fe-hydrogenase I cytochrome b subunit